MAGITKKDSMCILNANPIRKHINKSHLFGLILEEQYLVMHQNIIADISDDKEYTSLSVAEVQKVSEKANTRDPAMAETNITILGCCIGDLDNILVRKNVAVQNRNITVSPDVIAESIFIQYATSATLPNENNEKIRAINTYKGAPGGCPTCNPYPTAIHSPQSQKLTEGSTVSVYIVVDITNKSSPIIVLYLLKVIYLTN